MVQERIAEPVSQLETPVTIIMEGRFVLYYEFRLLCCASSLLPVRELGRRMKHSKATFDVYDDWSDHYLDDYYALSTVSS